MHETFAEGFVEAERLQTRADELEKFVVRVRPTIERYVAKRVRNRDHAEELVSRVMEALVRTWDSFRGDCPTEAYAVLIAANALKNYYSRDLQKLSRQISLDDWVETYSLQREEEARGPYTRLETQQWVENLLREMRRCCSEVECSIIGMFYQGQTFDEISKLSGMNAATVRGHFLRGRRKLLVHILVEAPDLLGGKGAVEAALDRIERQQPDLLTPQESAALRMRSGSAELLRSAMTKLAPYLEDVL